MDQDLYEEPKTPSQIAEMMLECALVDFRTMKPDLQRAFVVAILDEYCARAKEGKFDEYFAGQMLTRTELIASFLTPRRLRVVGR